MIKHRRLLALIPPLLDVHWRLSAGDAGSGQRPRDLSGTGEADLCGQIGQVHGAPIGAPLAGQAQHVQQRANTRPHFRQPTFQPPSSTVPAAVCSSRRRVRRPLRAKSRATPLRGQANGARRCRTGAHRSPHTKWISRLQSCQDQERSSTERHATERSYWTSFDELFLRFS